MNTPNKYITIIFILAVLYAVYELILTPDQKNNVLKRVEEIESSAENVLLEKTTAKEFISKPVEDTFAKEQRSKKLIWSRNPFLFPKDLDPYRRSEKKLSQAQKKLFSSEDDRSIKREKPPLSIKVSSILISGNEKVATIDQAPFVISVGDWVQDEQVIDIKADRIILGRRGKRREIFLGFLNVSHGEEEVEK